MHEQACQRWLLTLRSSAASEVATQDRLTITAEVVVVFVIWSEFFCIHLLKGRLRNDTSLCYQAPFPASAQSLQGRYPYGTQTHPLTSQNRQPRLPVRTDARFEKDWPSVAPPFTITLLNIHTFNSHRHSSCRILRCFMIKAHITITKHRQARKSTSTLKHHHN